MKMTLKKFAEDPKHLIKKAPIIILINKEPAYAIIPYIYYKQNNASDGIHENTVRTMETSTPKPSVFKKSLRYLHYLLFE